MGDAGREGERADDTGAAAGSQCLEHRGGGPGAAGEMGRDPLLVKVTGAVDRQVFDQLVTELLLPKLHPDDLEREHSEIPSMAYRYLPMTS